MGQNKNDYKNNTINVILTPELWIIFIIDDEKNIFQILIVTQNVDYNLYFKYYFGVLCGTKLRFQQKEM